MSPCRRISISGITSFAAVRPRNERPRKDPFGTRCLLAYDPGSLALPSTVPKHWWRQRIFGKSEPAMTQILQGQVVALFAFDLGFEVSLEQLGELFVSMPAPRLTQKKQTPAYLQYARPPRIVNSGQTSP